MKGELILSRWKKRWRILKKNVSYDSFIHDVATLGTLDSTTRPQMHQVGTLPGGQFMKFQYLEPWPSNKYGGSLVVIGIIEKQFVTVI